MENTKWLNLQLFAGEGAGEGGGEGAATGAETTSAGDADQARLRELGVPETLLEKRAKRNATKQSAAKAAPEPEKPAEADEPTEEQDAAAETDNPAEEKQDDKKQTKKAFKELLEENPDYNREVQSIVQARLRTAKVAEDNLSKLMPALEVLARKYGQDPTKIDYDALSKAIHDEDEYYEDKALEKGISIAAAKEIDQRERQTVREQARQALAMQEQQFADHIRNLEQQGEKLKAQFPNFDLRKELQDPRFQRMTSPSGGLSVEDAYYAIHRQEIQAAAMQATQRQTAAKLSKSIQSGKHRPAENGTASQAPSVTTFDYNQAGKDAKAKFTAWVKSELAAGRNPRPEDFPG